MAKQTHFEREVDGVLAEAAKQQRVIAQPPAVDQTNAELRAEWAKVGVPLQERLKEIGRTPQFKKAVELSRAQEELLSLGYNRERVTPVVDAAKRGTLLHNRALAQLVRVESAIFSGMDPSQERPHIHGSKQSDTIRYELRAISHADVEIESYLMQCQEYFAAMHASLKKPIAVGAGREKA